MAHGHHAHAHHHVPEEPERAAQHAQPASQEEEVGGQGSFILQGARGVREVVWWWMGKG